METISLARGVPAPECIPVEELADCARSAIEEDGATVLSYGSSGGYAPLRAWIAEQHGVPPARVVVTNGSLQGFVFLAQLLAKDGARVLVEAPTYDRPLLILGSLGAEVVGIPLAEHGIDLDALQAELEGGPAPALLYTIPTFQNPTGETLSADGRRRLVELAAERDLLVLEDDPYGLVRFGALERNLGLVRSLLKARRDALLAALEERLGGGGARWNRPEGGYFLWLELPEGEDAKALLRSAEAAGVTFVPGPDFFPRGGGGGSAVRLAFSFASPAEIGEAVGRLASLLSSSSSVQLGKQDAA
jgi:DNA-binding transcriptional MocR family regulator